MSGYTIFNQPRQVRLVMTQAQKRPATVARATKIVRAYDRLTGSGDDAIVDLIADLLILAHERGESIDITAASAISHAKFETNPANDGEDA